ncbi:MAG: portal protein [Planctomycetota bacterium]|jgi:hypothetical protein
MQSIEAIKDFAKKIFGIQRDDVAKGEGLQRPVTKEMAIFDRTSLRYDRQSKIKQCQEMANSDARIARMLYKLASDSVVGGFSLQIESGASETIEKQAQEIIDVVIEKCEILRKLKGWIKSCLREGDLFLEVIVDDATREIVRLKKLATAITFSNMDAEGNFPDDKEAYYQEHPWTREKIKTFEAWQIVHIPWEYEDGKPYGEPMFGSARLPWERLSNGEKNIVIRRAVRAGTKQHHKVGTEDKPGSWQEVEEYKRRNQDALENPLSPVQDYFSNGMVNIDDIGGDAELGNLADIEHFEGLLAMAAGIPIALLSGGREESINRDVLEEQEEDYFRVVHDINDTFAYGLRKIFNFALLLGGIHDESIKYSFNWGAKDRDDIDAKIARGEQLQKLGFSFETIFNVCDFDELTYEDEVERIQKQIEDGVLPYGVGMKLDPNMLMLLSGIMGGDKLSEQISKLREVAEEALNGKAKPKPKKKSVVSLR